MEIRGREIGGRLIMLIDDSKERIRRKEVLELLDYRIISAKFTLRESRKSPPKSPKLADSAVPAKPRSLENPGSSPWRPAFWLFCATLPPHITVVLGVHYPAQSRLVSDSSLCGDLAENALMWLQNERVWRCKTSLRRFKMRFQLRDNA